MVEQVMLFRTMIILLLVGIVVLIIIGLNLVLNNKYMRWFSNTVLVSYLVAVITFFVRYG